MQGCTVIRLIPLLAFLLAAPAAQAADDAKTLGTFGKWTAFSSGAGGKMMCYVALPPAKSEGTYKNRGDVMLTVTHRPGDKAFDVVSLVAGYQYLGDSDVAVTVGTKKFALFTSADRGWARDAATDKQIVEAMLKAANLTAKGTSSKNNVTTDTFALGGFTAAYRAISDACKKPK